MDKFHFPGHKVTDKYCRENCNPILELKKLGIEVTNTPACEQAFKWINAFKNLKTMNEAHFKFFLLYVIDLHNLNIQNKLTSVANPLNEDREIEDIMAGLGSIDLEGETKLSGNEEKDDSKVEVEKVKDRGMRLEDCYRLDDGVLHCKICPGTYKREGHMKNHVETKHNLVVDLTCKCGQLFTDTTKYCRHRKSCK